VVINGVTGFVIPRGDPLAAAQAIERLVLDAGMRKQMGMAGRAFVAKNFDWKSCIDQMISVYESVL
jgi:glycosyltransferase involved in cell wall biosynthesis